ncbi:hypothetical protein THAOC_12307, partial [Thalassiosira oceanica]
KCRGGIEMVLTRSRAATPPAVAPPPPPPPPPMPGAANVRREAAAPAASAAAAATQAPAYLQIRVPRKHTCFPSRIHRRKQPRVIADSATHSDPHHHARRPPKRPSNDSEGEIVRVLIPPNGFDSEGQLSNCLNQASAIEDVRVDDGLMLEGNSSFEYFENREKPQDVAGMFRERDNVFVPLSVICADPTSFVGDVLSIKRPPPLRRRPKSPINKTSRSKFYTFIEILGVLLVSFVSWLTYSRAAEVDWDYALEEAAIRVERVFFHVMNSPFWLFDALIQYPLKELYRHGPSIVGWEGETLPRICAQITYHGDEAFWSRNMDECERIYQSKEAAAMQIRKPIAIGCMIFIAFFMVKSIVEARARALQRQQRVDPNMVETYQAIHMLIRQLKRAGNF